MKKEHSNLLVLRKSEWMNFFWSHDFEFILATETTTLKSGLQIPKLQQRLSRRLLPLVESTKSPTWANSLQQNWAEWWPRELEGLQEKHSVCSKIIAFTFPFLFAFFKLFVVLPCFWISISELKWWTHVNVWIFLPLIDNNGNQWISNSKFIASNCFSHRFTSFL